MMKKTIGFVLALAFLLCIAVPAFAFETAHYLLYDATNLLDQTVMQEAENEMMRIAEDHQTEIHVDVVTDTKGMELYECAASYYTEYHYGYGESGDCVSLMIHVTSDADGLALLGSQLYCDGANAEYLWGYGDYADQYFGAYLTEDAWNGDITADNETFTAILEEFLYSLEAYLLGIMDALEPGAPLTGDDPTPVESPAPEEPEPIVTEAPVSEPETPAAPVAAEPEVPAEDAPLDFVVDDARLLKEDQWLALETQAQNLASTYKCSVYAILVDNYADFGNSPEKACDNIYRDYNLGQATQGEAMVLLLSMKARDYWLKDFGPATGKAITSYGHESIKKAFLDNFGKDDWFGGITDYLTQSKTVLQAAKDGKPLDKPIGENAPKAFGIAFVLAVVVALIVCSSLKAKMKTAVKAVSADEYVSPMGVEIHIREDQYTHTTTTRRKIQEESSSSSGSNNSSGGKF